MFWQLVLVAAAVGAVYYRWTRRRLRRLADEIPSGLKCYPVIGHAYMFLGSSEDRMAAFQKLARVANQQGGLSSFWLGHKFFISMTDPEAIEVVTKTCLDKEEVMTKLIRMVVGNGVIYAPVNLWHTRRKISAPFYNLKNLNNLVPVFDKKSGIMVDLMRVEVGGGDYSIWKYMTTYTADTVCETAAGFKMNFQENPDHHILLAIDEVSQMVANRMFQPWLHPDSIYERLPVFRQFQHHLQLGNAFIDEIIRKKRKKDTIGLVDEKENNEYTDFLQTIIQTSGVKEKGYSDLELREELMVMLIAGNDTSAVASSFTAVMLSRHPDVQDKVYQELQEVFGDSDRAVTSEDLPQLKYLEAVIKETMRLYTPVPLITRRVQDDLVLPSGITLVAGTTVLINIWGAHRNPAYWGADAELFRPERFLQGALPHPAIFIPFSFSVRGCIGSRYAMFSAKTALANLVRRYRLLPPAGARAADLTRPLPVKFEVMMKAVDHFIVRVTERNDKTV